MFEGEPTFKLSGEELKQLVKPCLYGWKRGGVWLYIGFSMKGIERLLRRHDVVKAHAIKDTDEIIMWFPLEGKSKIVLQKMEEALIGYYKPLYNTSNKNVQTTTQEAKDLLTVVKALGKMRTSL